MSQREPTLLSSVMAPTASGCSKATQSRFRLSSWISQDELSHMTVLEEGTCGWDKLQLLIERPGHKTGCLQVTLLGQLGIAERKESQWDYFNPLWMQMIPSPPATKSHCQSSPHRHLFSRGWGVCLSLFEINSLGCRGQTLVSVSASCLSILRNLTAVEPRS